MTRRLVCVVGAWLAPVALSAQLTVSGGVTGASGYVFRGVTVTNSGVLQPDLALTLPVAGGSVTVAAWGNVEPSRRRGLDDLSQTGGVRAGLAELDLFAEYGRDLGRLHGTVGVLHYDFNPHNGTVAADYNTDEVYGKLSTTVLGFVPEVRAYLDVRTIHGWYLEGQVARTLGRVTAAALAGYAAGEEQQGPDDGYYAFAKRGLTHVDLSLAATFVAGPWSIAPVAHLQFSPVGQNTRITGATAAHRDVAQRFWLGVRVGGSGRIGGHATP